jgi:hypothetical protein
MLMGIVGIMSSDLALHFTRVSEHDAITSVRIESKRYFIPQNDTSGNGELALLNVIKADNRSHLYYSDL